MLISLATSTTTITISAQLAWGIHCQVNEQHLFILNARIQEAQKQRQLSELVRVHNEKKRRANHGHKWKKWTTRTLWTYSWVLSLFLMVDSAFTRGIDIHQPRPLFVVWWNNPPLHLVQFVPLMRPLDNYFAAKLSTVRMRLPRKTSHQKSKSEGANNKSKRMPPVAYKFGSTATCVWKDTFLWMWDVLRDAVYIFEYDPSDQGEFQWGRHLNVQNAL